jgi:stage II sporulation protein D
VPFHRFCASAPLRNPGLPIPKGLRTEKFFLWSLLLSLLFITACGRHKAQVKRPQQPPSSTSTPSKKPSVKTQAPSTRPIPKAEVPTPQFPPRLPAKSEEGQTAPDQEISPGPMIRIGLMTAAKEIRISSSEAFYFMEKKPEASRQSVQGEIKIRIEQGSEGTISVYRIQIASFGKREKAEELQEKISGKLSAPVTVHENPDSGMNQVRVGSYSDKESARDLLKELTASGYPDAFIIREEGSPLNGKPTLALRGSDEVFQISQAGFLLMPSSATSFLCVNGKPYRGSFDVFLNNSGSITVVNQVEVEEYLLGVVPAELNPTSYPEFEALAAQSIAARTYALKNMGRFRSEGFDLSDDTRTQVYTGVSGEKAVTNDIVRQTSGIAIYYEDKLIDAMFMSTCGGRTEDVSEVYDSPPVPYLKSVSCSIESGPEKGEIFVNGKHALDAPFLADDGRLANRDLEFARILGLIAIHEEASPEYFAAPIKQDEARHWIKKAGEIAQKIPPGDLNKIADINTRAGFLQYAATSFFGMDMIRKRISSSDANYYMANLKDGNLVSESIRYILSFLLQNSLWRPNADNTISPETTMRRGDALVLLLRWIESAKPEVLRKGTFLEADAHKNDDAQSVSIKVKSGNRTQELPLSLNPVLFRLDPGQSTPVDSLRLIGTEKIAFHVSAAGTIDFLEVELSPTGASSDRYSPTATWSLRIARSSASEKLQGLTGNIGDFKDLKPFRIGNSGRVVQIQAIGSRKSVVLNGYKVRNALGLKDTLFTLTRDFNPDGSISGFTFDGRGYGHGVGLCQTGAVGMARAGRSYEEILKTYYSGVQIYKAY